MKKFKRIALFAAPVLLLVVLYKAFSGGEEAIEIDTTKVIRADILEGIAASGVLYPVEELKIASDVSGEIIALFVEEGDSVQEGQLLAKIRPDNYINALERQRALVEQQRARLAQSRSDLAGAPANLIPVELNYKRQKDLYENKVISGATYETAQADYQMRQQQVISGEQQVLAQEHGLKSTLATLREARENLRQTNLLAPISGQVTRLLVVKGERVVGTRQMAGTPMMHIGDLQEMDIHANVVENDIIRIQVGDSVSIDIESFSHLNRRFRGLVTAVATSSNAKINPEEVTEFKIEIRVLRSSYEHLIAQTEQTTPLRPGMTASVEIFTEFKQDVLLVPLSAVTIDRSLNEEEDQNASRSNTPSVLQALPQEILYVYDSNTSTVSTREVETGITGTRDIEITQGLEVGEIVVTGPALAVSRLLEDQASVVIREKTHKKHHH